MQSLNKLEKSEGVVLYAFNNADTNYMRIAEHATSLITNKLKLPVTIITGTNEVVDFAVDSIIRIENNTSNQRFSTDHSKMVHWRNTGRYTAYECSPYQTTILLDSDYLILDDSLLKYLSLEWDYLLPHRNINTGYGETFDSMGTYSLPYLWATIVMFRRSEKARMLFELVGKIQRNYSYYKLLYNIPVGNFRNDFAFTIANSILNGYSISARTKLSQPIITAPGQLTSLQIEKNMLIARYADAAHLLPIRNLHVLSKEYLLSDHFSNFVQEFCA